MLAALVVALSTAAPPARAGFGFTPVATAPDALTIPSIALSSATGPFSYYTVGAIAVRGRGLFELAPDNRYLALPCADAELVDFRTFRTYNVSTSCGAFAVAQGVATPAGVGLPAGTRITTLFDGLAGTSDAGVFVFGPTFTPSNNGLPANAPVRSLAVVNRKAYVSLFGGGLYTRLAPYAGWDDASMGLPPGRTVTAVGGATSVFAAVESAGIWRLGETGVWRSDSDGARALTINGFAGPIGAAGPAGVLRRANGAWIAETSGLPEGSDVRSVSVVQVGGDLRGYRRQLYVGTGGHGLFTAFPDATVRTLPAIVETAGVTGQPFRTELTIGIVDSGIRTILNDISVLCAPGTEVRSRDAASYLRSIGVDYPVGSGPRSLTATFSFPAASPGRVYLLARVYTTDATGGTYGVLLEAPTDINAAEEEGSVYGLRSAAGLERSNLALVHLPGRGPDPIRLSVRVFAADGNPAPNILERVVAPGEFVQLNDVLLLAGLPQGRSGYARIARVAGTGAWSGYGVVNDAATSDGSVLPLYRPRGVAAARRLLVPIVLDAHGEAGSHFTTELTLANGAPRSSSVALLYHPAPGYGAPLVAPAVTIPMKGGEQTSIPDVLAFLRERGVAIPDPSSAGAQAGTLEVVFRGLEGDDVSTTVALARTTTPNPNREVGGRFGVAYPAIAWGGGARRKALVPALSQDVRSRSCVAVVNAGGGSEGAITLSVQLRDAESGSDVGHPLIVSLNPGEWFQWNRVLEAAGTTTTGAIATVTRVSGDDTFFAYGVVNDAKTSDGSFVRMISLDED